jgi:hypothetical protein
MTRDEVKKILGEGATEEQITNYLDGYHTIEKEKNKEISELKAQLSKFNDYDEIKKKLDDIEKANMTEQEKLQEMKKEYEKNLHDSKIIVNKAKAKQILAGLDISDDIINSLVVEDEAQTTQNATNLASQINTIKEAVVKQTKEELNALDVKPNISNVDPNKDNTMTWDKFTKLSQEEQSKFQIEHPDEFAKL